MSRFLLEKQSFSCLRVLIKLSIAYVQMYEKVWQPLNQATTLVSEYSRQCVPHMHETLTHTHTRARFVLMCRQLSNLCCSIL